MKNFSKKNQNSDSLVAYLAHIADSCSPKNSKSYAFFEKKSEIFQQKGIIDSKKNDIVAATEDFIKALESAKHALALKGVSDNDDLHYIGQLNECIGDQYNMVNSVKPASYFYNQALNYFDNAMRHHEVIELLLKIGDLYQNNHIPEIALLNYETAEERKNLSEKELNDILIRKGISLYDVFDTKTADSIYGLMWTKSLQNIEYKYFTACHLYYKNNLENSLTYFTFCFENGEHAMKLKSAEKLADAYFRLGDRSKELFYAQYQAKSTSAEARLTPVKMQLETAYDSFIAKESANSQDNNKHFNLLLAILLVTATLLIGVFIAYRITKKKNVERENAIKEKEEIIDSKEKIIDDKEKIIDDMTKKLENARKADVIQHSFNDNFHDFINTSIYKDIKETLEGKTIMTKTVGDYPRLALSKVKIVTLTSKFNECFPNLIHTLSEMHPDLTLGDFRYIILSLIGFSNLEIAVLLSLTYSSSTKRSKHIKDVFNTEEPLEHFLPSYLRTIKY